MSLLVQLDAEGLTSYQGKLRELLGRAKQMTGSELQLAHETRANRRSQSAVRAQSAAPDKYATARRFSIARARSLEKSLADVGY